MSNFVDALALATVNKLHAEGIRNHPHHVEAVQKDGITEVTLTVFFKGTDIPLAPYLPASEGGYLADE